LLSRGVRLKHETGALRLAGTAGNGVSDDLARAVTTRTNGVLAGVYLHKRVSDRFFFGFVYLLLFVVGLRLVYDGITT